MFTISKGENLSLLTFWINSNLGPSKWRQWRSRLRMVAKSQFNLSRLSDPVSHHSYLGETDIHTHNQLSVVTIQSNHWTVGCDSPISNWSTPSYWASDGAEVGVSWRSLDSSKTVAKHMNTILLFVLTQSPSTPVGREYFKYKHTQSTLLHLGWGKIKFVHGRINPTLHLP